MVTDLETKRRVSPQTTQNNSPGPVLTTPQLDRKALIRKVDSLPMDLQSPKAEKEFKHLISVLPSGLKEEGEMATKLWTQTEEPESYRQNAEALGMKTPLTWSIDSSRKHILESLRDRIGRLPANGDGGPSHEEYNESQRQAALDRFNRASKVEQGLDVLAKDPMSQDAAKQFDSILESLRNGRQDWSIRRIPADGLDPCGSSGIEPKPQAGDVIVYKSGASDQNQMNITKEFANGDANRRQELISIVRGMNEDGFSGQYSVSTSTEPQFLPEAIERENRLLKAKLDKVEEPQHFVKPPAINVPTTQDTPPPIATQAEEGFFGKIAHYLSDAWERIKSIF